MQKLIVAVLLVLVAFGPATALSRRSDDRAGKQPGASIDPALQAILNRMAPDQWVSAIAILRDQVDHSAFNGGTRHARSVGLTAALRERAERTQGPLLALLNQHADEGSVTRIERIWIVNAISFTAHPAVVLELARSPIVARIVPEQFLTAPSPPNGQIVAGTSAEPNIDRINAPALWTMGYRGTGVVVASMDTGVDVDHPDLASRWRGGPNSWFDPYGQHPAVPTDVSGHGTQTTGVIVGGYAGGTSIGVAPDAEWIAVKIFNDRGVATSTAIHQGYQWLLDPDGDPITADEPAIVNNSWSLGSPGCNLDFEPDLSVLVTVGIVPVFAAGNFGPGTGTAVSPANNPDALAVGATDAGDVIASFSSRGPNSCGRATPETFPSIVAPGVDVRTSDLYGLYTTVSGTSLAAPHASGALALLLNAFPDASVAQLDTALSSSALDLGVPGPDNAYGSGRIDALAAYHWLQGSPTPSPTPNPTSSASPSPSPSTDLTGPMTSDVVAAPNPADGRADVAIGASIDDAETGDSGIAAAELFIDTPGPNGTGATLSGAFGPVATLVSGALASATVAALAEGPHSVLVHGRDGAGNWGPYGTTVLVVDRSGPSLASLSAAPVQSNGAATISLAGVAQDSVSSVVRAEWFLDRDPGEGNGQPWLPADGAFGGATESLAASISTGGLPAGEHLLSGRAGDAAGNWGPLGTLAILVTPTDTVFADGFESGDLSRWSAVSGATKLSVSPGATFAGRFGLTATLAGKTPMYVTDDSPAGETSFHARLYFHPHGTSTSGAAIGLLVGRNVAGTTLVELQYRRPATGGGQLRIVAQTAGGPRSSAWFTVSDAYHAVEIVWAAGVKAIVSLSVDGALREQLAGVDTSAYRLDSVRLGPSVGLKSNLTGVLSFDAFVSSRTTVIGP